MPSYRDSLALTLLRNLVRAGQRLEAWHHADAASRNMAPSEFDLVMTLGNTEGMRMCDAAARMLTSPPNVTRIAKRLEERGLVERQRSPASDREVLIRLTPEGERLFEVAYPEAYRRWALRFSELFNEGEQRQLADLLSRIAAAPNTCGGAGEGEDHG